MGSDTEDENSNIQYLKDELKENEEELTKLQNKVTGRESAATSANDAAKADPNDSTKAAAATKASEMLESLNSEIRDVQKNIDNAKV